MTFKWTSSETDSLAVLDRAWEAGINFIDTADVYTRWAQGNPGGTAETIIGSWMKSKPREQLVIATKVRGHMWEGPNGEGLSRVHIIKACEDSLRRLQTDHIDLYQCHHPDPDTPFDETLRAFDDLVRAGKVRYIGLSNYPAWQTAKTLWLSDRHNLVSVVSTQPRYSIVHRDEFERELQPLCAAEGIGVIPYSPLQGGFLTGKYKRGQGAPAGSRGVDSVRIKEYYENPRAFDVIDKLEEVGRAHGKSIAETALAWVLTNPTITSPIIGANTVEQLNALLGAAGYRLSAEEMIELDKVSRGF
jgi:aryl-alcohol dehydrogenase-like predicted oxidoreductase